jgi:RNA polymerase sigma factor (sigma-70 family)
LPPLNFACYDVIRVKEFRLTQQRSITAQALAKVDAADLIRRWREGDQPAAGELFRRYADRLIALARGRLSAKLARSVDPEDIVQSAYRSFFADTREGRYSLERGGDLWQLLVTITLHKLQHRVERSQAQKRAVEQEQHFGSEDSLLGLQPHLLRCEPSPAEAIALADEMEQLMGRLDSACRRILELRLQGHNLAEVATQTDCSVRSVQRALERIKQQLKQDCFSSARDGS